VLKYKRLFRQDPRPIHAELILKRHCADFFFMRNSYKAPLQSQDAGATLSKLYSIKGINHQAFEFIGGSSMVRVKSAQNYSAWSMSRSGCGRSG
jgi:uncharacterized protein (UPF0303 family)